MYIDICLEYWCMNYMGQGLKLAILLRNSKKLCISWGLDFGALVNILAICIWKNYRKAATGTTNHHGLGPKDKHNRVLFIVTQTYSVSRSDIEGIPQ